MISSGARGRGATAGNASGRLVYTGRKSAAVGAAVTGTAGRTRRRGNRDRGVLALRAGVRVTGSPV